jgi:hypothetical protein
VKKQRNFSKNEEEMKQDKNLNEDVSMWAACYSWKERKFSVITTVEKPHQSRTMFSISSSTYTIEWVWIRVVACMQILPSKSNKNVSWNYPIPFLFFLIISDFLLTISSSSLCRTRLQFNMNGTFFLVCMMWVCWRLDCDAFAVYS